MIISSYNGSLRPLLFIQYCSEHVTYLSNHSDNLEIGEPVLSSYFWEGGGLKKLWAAQGTEQVLGGDGIWSSDFPVQAHSHYRPLALCKQKLASLFLAGISYKINMCFPFQWAILNTSVYPRKSILMWEGGKLAWKLFHKTITLPASHFSWHSVMKH